MFTFACTTLLAFPFILIFYPSSVGVLNGMFCLTSSLVLHTTTCVSVGQSNTMDQHTNFNYCNIFS